MVLDLLPVILQEKLVIRAKLETGFAWHPCLVLSICDNKAELGLSRILAEDIVESSNKIQCKYSTEFFEYLMEGTIDTISNFPAEEEEAGKIIGVTITKVDERLNDRVTSRFDVYLAASAYSSWQPEKKDILIHNISLTGLSFISSSRFEPIEEYIFQILLDKQTLELEGKIIRRFVRADLYHYGVKFRSLSDFEKERLLNYFDLLIKQDEDLRNYYSCFV